MDYRPPHPRPESVAPHLLNHWSNRTAAIQWTALLLHMLGVPGLGLGKKTGYPETISVFPQSKTNAGPPPQITPRHFFTRPIQFVIQHQLANHAK